jgi:biopolymer transport protein ExbD
MAFGGDFNDEEPVMSDINMTPLVDVMLVLLIIFIITVPVLTQSVKLDLPRADSSPNEIKPNTVNLSVTDGGQIHWNETAISMDELALRLDALALQEPQPEVHIRGARTVEYEHVMKVMAAAQRAGIHKLGFVTEPES